jgi:FlaA1/EpsC-like NDP-sugar epimerase
VAQQGFDPMSGGRIGWRSWLAFFHDVTAAAIAWAGLYWVRFGGDLFSYFASDLLTSLALVVPLQAAIFVAFSLYRGLWRFASLVDLRRIVTAAALGSVLIPLATMMLRVDVVLPRSVLVLYPVLLVGLMAGSRFAYRLWKEHRLYSPFAALGEPVLVLGAGEAGALLTKELERSRQWRVVGLLDDDPAKRGRMLRNVQVLGSIDEVGQWAERYGVRQAIIAMPSADHSARRRAAEKCARAGLETLTVPAYADLISGRFPLSTVRQVELDDLLGRDPVVLDTRGLSEWLGGRTVMVTGAGGSIGAELCRQIARFAPARLVLFEISEYALYQIAQALADEFAHIPTTAVIGDVKNAGRVREVLALERPSVVFHAAAYKHVPLMEERNAWEAVRNNSLGTVVLARAAVALGVEKFVLVSTDKAVNPTNVMGASKRLAELLCQQFDGRRTQFVIVRFGNVVGSTGSVIPRFRDQIARGGPLTVTHPDVTRYFMSVAEATQLLLQAGLMGRHGEVLVLDMGEPVRIVDLARELILLSGEDPQKIGIEFSGLRPGEKLYEEPLANGEATLPTPHPKLRIALALRPGLALVADAMGWLSSDRAVSDSEARAMLARLLPEYAASVSAAQRAPGASDRQGPASAASLPAPVTKAGLAPQPAPVTPVVSDARATTVARAGPAVSATAAPAPLAPAARAASSHVPVGAAASGAGSPSPAGALSAPAAGVVLPRRPTPIDGSADLVARRTSAG